MSDRLIACVLGGTAPRAKTELHDVAFAVGDSLESVHDQLLDSWFGDPNGLHVDAWCFLESVEGYRLRLERTPADNGLHLYFLNIGGYRPGEFGERHAWGFFGARNKSEAKDKARQTLLVGHTLQHKDDLYDVDDCLRIGRVQDWHVHLEPDADARPSVVTNGYFPLPASTVRAWQERHKAPRPS
ncbi:MULTISPECIES: DUF1543 domain-containing protein [Oleiagrimonas]|uniref:DUF1543 domain-containing protein n=1 Tax=Oleiagrimonas citrea TaxID=1665687 RepID=A0A846ZKN8_9GAMM|nr:MULTISPECIES: DUF1543 domain-containing protein [Oleiagrimonas]NKZ38875.1 DUF1543 domain-containing protein [Oleiagrimonas citrea]RAP59145.1 hypothetical protein BTJ49_00160 [Oleiagrimonas sp. MCCC 1A03011]